MYLFIYIKIYINKYTYEKNNVDICHFIWYSMDWWFLTSNYWFAAKQMVIKRPSNWTVGCYSRSNNEEPSQATVVANNPKMTINHNDQITSLKMIYQITNLTIIYQTHYESLLTVWLLLFIWEQHHLARIATRIDHQPWQATKRHHYSI